MSYDATDWAMELRLADASQKLVLLALAYHHNRDTGLCCPSVATIAERCALKDRAIRGALKSLDRQGVIAIEGNTHRRRYRLMFDAKLPARDAASDADLAAANAGVPARDAGSSGSKCRLTRKQQGNNNSGAVAPDHEQPADRTKPRAQPVRDDANSDAADRSRRGTRLPQGWQPPPGEIASIERELPQVNWRAETEKFRDYWIAQPGQRGCKLDWPATWRNWMRNSLLYGARRQANASGAVPLRLSPTAPPPGGPWQLRLRTFRERGLWSPDWGPKPGEEGCRVPKEVVGD